MDGGQLVPDHLVTKIVINEIPDGPFLLDGFPRTVVQAEELGNAVEIDAVIDLDVPFDVIEVSSLIRVELTRELICQERLTSRWVHPGSGRVYNTGFSDPKVPGKDDVTGEDLIQRDDDKPETVQARLKVCNKRLTFPNSRSFQVYEDTCGPLREFYAKQGKLHTFSGNATAIIWPQVEEFLKKAYKD